MSGSGRADRSARLRNLNHDPLSRHCRFSGLLSLDSRPVTGNSVRRAGSNSPRRSGPPPELRRGPGPDSVHSFFGRFARSSPGGGGTLRPGWELCGIASVITFAFGRGCAAAGLGSEMCFMLFRMPLRPKPGDVHSRNCRFGRRGEGGDQALMGAGGWARHSIKNTESWPNGSRSTEFI
jgi:hypothetical protein